MARLILLVVSGTLLLCQTLATFSTSGEDDDDGSSSGSVVQEENMFNRNVDPTALHSWPAGPEQQGSRNPASNPAHDPYHQQTLLAEPQPQPRAYPVYQPAPAVQPQYEPYTGYQPFPGAQRHAEPYSVYQPSPAVQPQAQSYPVYQPAPAVQPQAQAYPYYQPAPAIQPHAEPYLVYQPSPAVQPHAKPYPVYQLSPAVQPQAQSYPFYQPASAVQPQAESYLFYQPAPATQPLAGPYPVYQPSPAVQPQAQSYPFYQPAPAVQPQAQSYPYYQPAPATQPQAQSYPYYQPAPSVQPQAQSYPVYQQAPVIQHQPVHQPAPVYPHPSYQTYTQITAPVPGQPTMMVRYIPGLVSRQYTCRQKVDCGWNYVTQPGRYIYVSIAPQRTIIQTCPRPQCNPVQPTCYPQHQVLYPPPPIVYPQPPIVYPPPPVVYPPVQPYYTCAGHNQCGASQQCCYGTTSANMGCYPGYAVAIRSQRHLQFNSTVTNRSRVELVVGDWRNSHVTSLVTDLLLPLKVDLENNMEVILLTDPKQNGGPCDAQDTDCIGPRILTCVAEMWPSVIQLLSDAGSVPNNNPFLTRPPSSPMAKQPEAGHEEPLANTTTDLSNHSDDDSRSLDEPSVSGDEPLEVFLVDPVASAAHARQVRLLSFTACLLQSFGSGVVERKKTALLAAKRCVRANKLDWPRVRACVVPRGHDGVARGDRGQDPPHARPTEIIVNGDPAPHQDNLKLALCQALLKAGQAPLLCDLLYDELDQRQEEQSIPNTEEGSTDTIPFEDQDSPSMRHTDYHEIGRGWSDQGLGFSQGLPRDQTQDGADRGQKFFRIQEAYGAEDAHGAMEAHGPQEAYGTQEAYRTQESYVMENQPGPEESEDQNVGFSMSRVNQSLDEVPASSTIWTGGVGNPYEV